MPVVVLASLKSSPGTTTAALALCQVWPRAPRVILIEADPAGGDVAARTGASPDPGLTTLAAAGRREITPAMIEQHCRSVAGVPALLCSPQPQTAAAALSTVAQRMASLLGDLGYDAVCDCGRLQQGHPAAPLIQAADLILIVARPTAVELSRVATAAKELGGRARVLLVTGSPVPGSTEYPSAEVAQAVGVPVIGTMPYDPAAASTLWSGSAGPRVLERSQLYRWARRIASAILVGSALSAVEPQPPAPGQLSLPLLRRAGQVVR